MNHCLIQLAFALSATLAPAFSQEIELQLDEPQVLGIRADDPIMTDGRGPSRVAVYVSDFTGTLYVWGTSDRAQPERVQPVLRIEVDLETVAENDGAGGRQDAWAQLQVRPKQKIRIIASSSAPEQLGDIELRVVAVPDTLEKQKAIAAARELYEESGRLVEGDRREDARSALALASGELLRVEGSTESPAGRDLAEGIGERAMSLGAYSVASESTHLMRVELKRVLPPVNVLHPETLLREIRCRLKLGEYQTASDLTDGAVEAMAAVHGPDGLQTAWMMGVVGNTMIHVRRYDEGHKQLEQALELLRSIPGAEAAERAASVLQTLAWVTSGRGDPRAALDLCEEAVAIYEDLGRTDESAFAGVLNGVAVMKIELGDLEDAQALLERAVKINEDDALVGRAHPNTAINLINLGRVALELGEFEEARKNLSECLEIRNTKLGPTHPKTGTCHMVFGDLYLAQGDYGTARAEYERARKIWQDASDSRESWAVNKLTWVCLELDEFAAAEDYLDQASEMHEAIYGSAEHHGLAIELDLRGLLLIEQRDFAGARVVLERSLDIRTQMLGADHSWTTRSARNLARLEQAEGGLEDALELLVTALKVEKDSSNGAATSATAATQHALASLQLDRGNEFQAKENCDRALETRQERLGEHHADVGRSKHLLGKIILAQGGVEAALPHVIEALEILTRKLGDDHLEAVACRETLAEIAMRRDEPERAVKLLEGVLRARIDSLGDDHVATLEVRARLAPLLLETGESERARKQYEVLLRVQEQTLEPDHEALEETRRGLLQALTDLGLATEAASVKEVLGRSEDSSEHAPTLDLSDTGGLIDEGERRWTWEGETRLVTLEVNVLATVGVKDVQIIYGGDQILASAQGDGLALKQGGRFAAASFQVVIPMDTNEVNVAVLACNNDGLWCDSHNVTLKYVPATRDLYVVAMGVSDYEDPSLDLAFPQEDVADLVDRLQQERGRHYDEVHVQELVGQAVNSGALEAARRTFLRPAQPGDTILVFAAGHGVRWIDPEEEDGPAKYYFLTHAATPTEAWKGIKWDDLYELATKGGKAKRRVLLLDTCQSGGAQRGVGQDFVSDTKAKKLLLSGVYVLAASSRTGFAEEADGNGLFTRALLAGLGGDADLEANGGNFNGTIEIEELYEFTREMVLRESGGRQKPTLPLVEGGENFPLVKVPVD